MIESSKFDDMTNALFFEANAVVLLVVFSVVFERTQYCCWMDVGLSLLD